MLLCLSGTNLRIPSANEGLIVVIVYSAIRGYCFEI